MKKVKLMFAFATLAAAVMLVPAPAFAAAPGAVGGDAWQFELTPYLFAAGMNGTTGMNVAAGDIDMSFSDILSNLDSAFMAVFEARKGPLLFGFEGMYVKLTNENAHAWQGPLDATMKEQVYQLSGGYRVVDDRVKVDVIGALRETMLDTRLNLTVTKVPLVDASKSWVDPVVGARVLVPLAGEWTAVGMADIGGFGAGSDLTYQLLAGVNWQFAKTVSAKFGYRYLYQDYKDNGFIWDMTLSGFYLGAGFQF